jgi:GMP synthase PP-ATPase subunit
MSLRGYNNRSKFIRETILSRRSRRRIPNDNESGLIQQIELFRLDIKRIGVNYNQRVRALNAIAARSVRGNSAPMQYEYFEYDMTAMKRMMDEMISKVNEIAGIIYSLDNTGIPDRYSTNETKSESEENYIQ